MGKKVFANGMEIAHQSGDAKVVAAFPDVCMSPPAPPAGPVPVPYPDSSKASDLKQGTKTVKIGGKPAAVKDSYYQTSPLGDEAATRSFGGSLLTHGITGKTYFAAHSMNVMMEGKPVARHLDLTTSNHSSYPGGTPPFPNLSEMHQLALTRVEEGKCPCCGKKECPAAFKDGEEPLSMKEAMGLDPKGPNYNPKKAEGYRLLRSAKRTECTCKGKAFPSPPCDVFREPDKERTSRIEGRWDESRGDYRKWHLKSHGIELKDRSHFLDIMMAKHSDTDLQAMIAAGKLPRAERANNPMWRRLAKMEQEADAASRINHLTPKKYGGCPDNPGNLQPMQTLCSVCQEIDQFMTDDQW